MRRYRRNPHCAGRVVDGLAFVITPQDSQLHTLNGPATALWLLAVDYVSVDDAVRALVETYEIDDETARRDAAECLEDLATRDILLAVDE